MDCRSNIYKTNFTSEFPGDQPPATSYPDPQKPGQSPPMNPTPDAGFKRTECYGKANQTHTKFQFHTDKFTW